MSENQRVEVARCTCSHTRANHTRGAGQCWQAMCGCGTYREPTRRIPDHLRTDDIRDYLRQKGEIS